MLLLVEVDGPQPDEKNDEIYLWTFLVYLHILMPLEFH